MPTSELLREAVERAIMSYDPIRTSETVIDVAVRDAEVVLNGYVRSDTMRSIATQLARKVIGVRTVRNLLLSDSELEITVGQALQLRLGPYVLPMMPVARVLRGHLFLRGPVPSESAKALVEEVAREVPGVVLVHNLLDVDPTAIERMVAPKKAARAAVDSAATGGQAMVGGKVVTAADLPAWAMTAKESWGMAEYKARARAKMAFKRSEGLDPNEMEAAGTILRAGAGESAPSREPEPVAAPLPVAEASAAAEELPPVEAAPVDLAAIRAQFPPWALKPKEEWDKDDFKAQMQAKRAAKAGEGEAPDAVIEKAQAALAAAQQGGGTQRSAAPKNAQEAALAAVRAQHPGWALMPLPQWRAQEFQAASEARVAELRGGERTVKAIRAEAQAALEAAQRGEAVAGGSRASRRDLTPEERAAVRQQLASDFPAWALKPKEEWDKDDFKGQMQAKRAAKSGEGEEPDSLIEKAVAALAAALKAAADALPLVGGEPEPQAGGATVADGAGPRTISPALLERYPGWALKPKEEWDAAEFKAHAKAKSAFKKGEGPDPDALMAEAQAALGA